MKINWIRAILMIVFLAGTSSMYAQEELIQNGDFEEFRRKGRFFLFNHLKYWYKPTWSSTDYQDDERRWKFNGTKVYSGSAYVGIVTVSSKDYDYAEYGTDPLMQELEKDSLYCLSMYVRLSEHSTVTRMGVDAYFSERRIKKFTRKHISSSYAPQLTSIGEQYITNRNDWFKIASVYKADGGESYVTIGKFYFDRDYFVFPEMLEKRKVHIGYLYVDLVSLVQINDSSECDCNIKRFEMADISKEAETDSAVLQQSDSVVFKEGAVIRLANLEFEHDSYEILQESHDELDQLYALLIKYPDMKIEINGYTDNTGTSKRNLYLSRQRAKAVTDYLAERGIPESRLHYKGHGPDNPIESNETEGGRAINRRVEFVVIPEE